MRRERRAWRAAACRPGWRDRSRHPWPDPSGGAVEKPLRFLLELDASILVRCIARHCGNTLHEVEQGFRRTTFLAQHRVDDPRGLRSAEPATPQERRPVLVGPGDDPLARRADTGDEGRRAAVGEALQRGRRLAGAAARRILAVANGDFLEILHTPQVPALANGAQIE